MQTTKMSGRYCFAINGKEGLKRSFIQERDITALQDTVSCEGIDWPLYAEPSVTAKFAETLAVKCVVSFQTFSDGEHIAIARAWKPKKHRILKQQAAGVR